MQSNMGEAADLDNVAYEIRQDLVLFDLLAVVADLLLHDALLVLQPQSL